MLVGSASLGRDPGTFRLVGASYRRATEISFGGWIDIRGLPTWRMRQSLRETLIWGTLGAISYVVGGLLLFVAVVPVASADGLDVGALTPLGAVLLLASLGCFALGAFCVRKGNPRGGQSSSQLPERFQKGVGSHERSGGDELRKRDLVDRADPPGEDEDARRPSNPEPASAVECPNCGTPNEREYTFCGHCSGRLEG